MAPCEAVYRNKEVFDKDVIKAEIDRISKIIIPKITKEIESNLSKIFMVDNTEILERIDKLEQERKEYNEKLSRLKKVLYEK